MPFTFSHPAIVLPLAKVPGRWFSVTGLVVGSMIPDFEYFMRMGVESRYSHSFSGVLLFDLPAALGFCFLFHCCIRNSLVENLPVNLKSRFMAFTHFNWMKHFLRNWLFILASIVIGALSHILWDSFTHPNRFFTDHFDSLRHPVTVMGTHMHVYNLLQHFCSLAGLVIVLMVIYELPKDYSVKPAINYAYWRTVFTLFVSGFYVRLFTSGAFEHVFDLALVSVSALLLALSLTPLLMKSAH